MTCIFCLALFSLSSCFVNPIKEDCRDTNLDARVEGNNFESCVISLVPYPNSMWIQAVGPAGKNSIHLYVPLATGTYTLSDSTFSGQYWDGTILNQTTYITDSTHTGTVTITKYDTANKLMSGTFSFTARQFYPTGTATKSVTNGSFTDAKWE